LNPWFDKFGLSFGSFNIPVRLLVVDDHEIVRMGVRILLSDNDRWEICGEAQDGVEAIQKVLDLTPDVVILDLTMPNLGGFDTALRIRRASPATKIIFFSIHETPTTARLVGADAFVSKSAAAGELAQTITRVMTGGGMNRTAMRYPDWTD
jgi:DNA-binding NarL/FixJ family response regulator